LRAYKIPENTGEQMKTYFYTAFSLFATIANSVNAHSIPVSYWNGPSTAAMNTLANDLIAYNEMKKNHHCVSIQFPALANSLIIYKNQLSALEQQNSTACQANSVIEQDKATLAALQPVQFYAITALQYPKPPATVKLLPAKYEENIMLADGLPNEVPGWEFSPNHTEFQFRITQ